MIHLGGNQIYSLCVKHYFGLLRGSLQVFILLIVHSYLGVGAWGISFNPDLVLVQQNLL